MITVKCSKDLYTYNAYHLARAFFPEEAARVFTDSSQSESVIFDIDGNVYTIPAFNSKDEVDKAVYAALKEIAGQSLPWGLLTGVRPTKPAMTKIKEGMEKDAFIRWYGEEKLVSVKKAALAWDIAQREICVLKKINPSGNWSNTCSIYIGIPFCPDICSYCSFSLGTISRYKDKIDTYVTAICREINETSKLCKEKNVTSIYIGGGTPTSLDKNQLLRLLCCIAENFPVNTLSEFCVEAGRPDTISKEKLAVMKEYGVSRICINPQTMQQKTLDKVGRTHNVKQVYEAFDAARQLGFDDINMDLIAGLPGEKAEDMEDTLSKVLALGPESLTVHALSIKRRAQMESQSVPAGAVSAMIELARKAAGRALMNPYYLYRQKSIAGNFENTGYAKPGREGIHNIIAIEEVQTVYGLGAGADTRVVLEKPQPNPSRKGKPARILRCSNIRDIDGYIANVGEMTERKIELENSRSPC